MYLAGRTTVEGERGSAGAGSFGRRLWPGAFWGMTAVAASLLAELPVADISIVETSAEEVIRGLFAERDDRAWALEGGQP